MHLHPGYWCTKQRPRTHIGERSLSKFMIIMHPTMQGSSTMNSKSYSSSVNLTNVVCSGLCVLRSRQEQPQESTAPLLIWYTSLCAKNMLWQFFWTERLYTQEACKQTPKWCKKGQQHSALPLIITTTNHPDTCSLSWKRLLESADPSQGKWSCPVDHYSHDSWHPLSGKSSLPASCVLCWVFSKQFLGGLQQFFLLHKIFFEWAPHYVNQDLHVSKPCGFIKNPGWKTWELIVTEVPGNMKSAKKNVANRSGEEVTQMAGKYMQHVDVQSENHACTHYD